MDSPNCTTVSTACQEAYAEINRLYAKHKEYMTKANALARGPERDAWIDLADGVDAQIETVLRDEFGFKHEETVDFFDMVFVGYEPDFSVDKIIHFRDEADHRATMNNLIFCGCKHFVSFVNFMQDERGKDNEINV